MVRVAIMILVVAAVSPALAQQQVAVGTSPVPIWPGDGPIPATLEKYSVFFDPGADQLVILPKALGRTGGAPVKFQLRRGAMAQITASVEQNAEGLYVYDYVLTNSIRSRMPLARWSLLIPAGGERSPAQAPPGWNSESEPTGMADQFAAQPVKLSYVHFSPVSGSLPPGASAGHFRLVSAYRPGYATCFVRGDPGGLPTLDDLPAAVKSVPAVRALERPEWDSRQQLVLAPRYLPETSGLSVAAGLHLAISKMADARRLRRDAAFVESALSALRGYLENRIPVDSASLASAAQTSAEEEVAEAMRLSLTPVSQQNR